MDLKKLNINQYDVIVVRNKPEEVILSFEYEEDDIRMDCLIDFIFDEHQLKDFIHYVHSLPQDEDRPLYLIFPKKSSKNYKTEISRDIITNEIKKDERFYQPNLMSLDDDFSIFSFRYKNS